MHLGYACLWDSDPTRTWSGTPWALRSALTSTVELTDLGVNLSTIVRGGLRVAHARRSNGRWTTIWQYSRLTDSLVHTAIDRAARRSEVDLVLQIQDLARLDNMPFATYQDLSYGVLLDALDAGSELVQFPGLTRRALQRRHERQLAIYEAADSVHVMSRWLASELIARGIDAAKVNVVHPGSNALTEFQSSPERHPRYEDRPPQLLFVGRDFLRKGGDLVLAALERLRRDHDPSTTLTIAGPTEQLEAYAGAPGASWIGDVGPARVAELMRSHDLLVVPSRFEAFGIVFAEALAHGTPVVARDAFAMPEIVTPGVNGALVRSEDPDELATAIADVLDDYELRQRTLAQQEAQARYWSWDRAAEDLLAAHHA